MLGVASGGVPFRKGSTSSPVHPECELPNSTIALLTDKFFDFLFAEDLGAWGDFDAAVGGNENTLPMCAWKFFCDNDPKRVVRVDDGAVHVCLGRRVWP